MKKITSKQRNSTSILIPILLLSIIEGICSIWATISIPGDSRNSIFFGLSLSRLGIIGISIIGIGLLIVLLAKKELIKEWISKYLISSNANRVVTGVGLLALFLLWVTIFTPTKNFFPYEAFFIRLRPLLIWVELILIQFTLFIKIVTNSFSPIDNQLFKDRKFAGGLFLLLVGIWVFITTTKIGLIHKTAFWFDAGIPLSTIQFVFIILFIFLTLILCSNQGVVNNKVLSKILGIMIPILIFGITISVWGSTPMLKHFFSLEPTLPNLQPYPYSDARVHDLGAISILKGDGINFHGYTDKPLFMAYLAFLHLFAGNNYTTLQWAQICALALIPVVLFFFGKKIHSSLFGLVLSAIIILQQRNAIVLSYQVASVNPKILASEEFMLLGILLVTYLFFNWMKKPEPKTILLLGGIIGALSLVRMNPVFLLPAIVITIILYFWKKPGILIKQTFLFGFGFLLVFSPWLFVGVNSEGKSWFFIKIQDVIDYRYPFSKDTADVSGDPNTNQLVSSGVHISDISYPSTTNARKTISKILAHDDLLSNSEVEVLEADLVFIMFNHYLHNFSTSLLALPDSITIQNLSDLTQRAYWHADQLWNGKFPPLQYIFILINLLMLGIGLVESWKRFRWAGLAPLIIFLSYDLSLSAAMNSGGRYIVPINWIFFFYYFIAIFLIAKNILRSLNLKLEDDKPQVSMDQKYKIANSVRSIIPTVVLVVLIAAIVPVTNLLVPVLVKSNTETITNIIEAVDPAQDGNQLSYGDVLYPYYEKDGKFITFDFLSNQLISTIQIETAYLVDTQVILESNLPAVLSYSTIEDGQQLLAIYLVNDQEPFLFWQKKP